MPSEDRKKNMDGTGRSKCGVDPNHKVHARHCGTSAEWPAAYFETGNRPRQSYAAGAAEPSEGDGDDAEINTGSSSSSYRSSVKKSHTGLKSKRQSNEEALLAAQKSLDFFVGCTKERRIRWRKERKDRGEENDAETSGGWS